MQIRESRVNSRTKTCKFAACTFAKPLQFYRYTRLKRPSRRFLRRPQRKEGAPLRATRAFCRLRCRRESRPSSDIRVAINARVHNASPYNAIATYHKSQYVRSNTVHHAPPCAFRRGSSAFFDLPGSARRPRWDRRPAFLEFVSGRPWPIDHCVGRCSSPRPYRSPIRGAHFRSTS